MCSRASIQHPTRDSLFDVLARASPKGPLLHEKNWMPLVRWRSSANSSPCAIRPACDQQARMVTETVPSNSGRGNSGEGSQPLIQVAMLALIPEAGSLNDSGQPVLRHRFVWLDEASSTGSCVILRFFFPNR